MTDFGAHTHTQKQMRRQIKSKIIVNRRNEEDDEKRHTLCVCVSQTNQPLKLIYEILLELTES